MKQKLALARTVLHRPPLVLLDEPTAGLDVVSANAVREGLESLPAIRVERLPHECDQCLQISQAALLSRLSVLQLKAPDARLPKPPAPHLRTAQQEGTISGGRVSHACTTMLQLYMPALVGG